MSAYLERISKPRGNAQDPFADKSATDVMCDCRTLAFSRRRIPCVMVRYEDERETVERVYEQHLNTSLVHECSGKYCQSKKRGARAVATLCNTR